MGLQDLLDSAGFADKSLYEVFNVDSTASSSAIKKAYHRLALKCHPDKNPDPEATKAFQALSGAYEVLSDEVKKKNYDECGLGEDGSMGMEEPDCGWTEYFSCIFQKVSEGKIKTFQDKYTRSEEEKADVLKWYVRCKGNLRKMLECVMLVCSISLPKQFK
jgi:DnaJ family protein C protein 9